MSTVKMSNQEIDELVARYQAENDELSFNKVYEFFRKQMAIHASKFKFYSLDSDDVRMMMEAVLVQAARTWSSAKGARFKTYFWTCVHNELISVRDKSNAKRREGEKTLSSLDAELTDDGGTLQDLIPSKAVSHEDEVLLKSSVRKIAEGYLKPLDKQIVLLLVEDPSLTRAELAKKVGKSDMAISDAIRRIRSCSELRNVLSFN
jgi:DNA-directed RNA polymerase specialized sigma subunit